MKVEASKDSKVNKTPLSWSFVTGSVTHFLRVFYVQFAQSFTLQGLLLILRTCVVVALPIIISVSSEREKAGKIDEVNYEISLAAFIAVFASILWSTKSGFQDRSTLDKNRIAYLRFGKQAIALGKVSGSSLQFTLQLVCAYLLVIVIAAAAGFDVSGQRPGRIIVYFISATFYFTLVQTGMRYATTLFEKKSHRLTAIVAWSMITLAYYFGIGVANLTTKESLGFFVNNSKWVGFIPFINAGLLDIMGGNLAVGLPANERPDFWNQVWPVLIMAAECVCICALVWKPFSAKLKTYLTT